MDILIALLGVLILIGLAVFQLLLIAGYPLGSYAWGGAHKVLPRSLRIGSVISILIYVFIGTIFLAKAEMLSMYEQTLLDSVSWLITIYFGLGVFLNAISRSKRERLAMTPVAFALFLISLMLSFT